MAEKVKLFFGGLPTGPDVQRIRNVYPENSLAPQQEISYAHIGEIIGSKYGTSRFISVTTSWRKFVEKEVNVIFGTDPGVAFVVLNEPEKVKLSERKLHSAAKFARRAYIISAMVNTKLLSDHEKARKTHAELVSANIISSAQIKSKTMLPTLGWQEESNESI